MILVRRILFFCLFYTNCCIPVHAASSVPTHTEKTPQSFLEAFAAKQHPHLQPTELEDLQALNKAYYQQHPEYTAYSQAIDPEAQSVIYYFYKGNKLYLVTAYAWNDNGEIYRSVTAPIRYNKKGLPISKEPEIESALKHLPPPRTSQKK